jgi:hypothetical protein
MKRLNYNECVGVMLNLANTAACAYQYKGWDNAFCREEIQKTHERMLQEYEVDPNDFTLEELCRIGFAKWDEDSGLILAPLWILPFLQKGIELTCIDGTKVIVGQDDIDNDIRFGCISYGINKQKDSHDKR